MQIPDSINFAQLEQLAKEASTGIAVVEATELKALCDEYILALETMISKIEDVTTASIHPDRFYHFRRARMLLKNARRNFQAAIKT